MPSVTGIGAHLCFTGFVVLVLAVPCVFGWLGVLLLVDDCGRRIEAASKRLVVLTAGKADGH